MAAFISAQSPGGVLGSGEVLSEQECQGCAVPPRWLLGTHTQAEAAPARMGNKALAAQTVTCFAWMLSVTKPLSAPFCLILGLLGRRGNKLPQDRKKGKKKLEDTAKMKLPAAGPAGPAGLASKEVADDVTANTGNSFPSSATAEKLPLLLLVSTPFLTGMFSPSSPSIPVPGTCNVPVKGS